MRNVALLVIDMQEHFRDIANKILPEINETIDWCRTNTIPVIFTQHGHRYLPLDSGVLGEKFGVQDMIVYGSQSWELLPELRVLKSDIIITEKRRYDAFYGTCLQDILRQQQVNCVIISGVMTNLCCETTARSAFVRDFNVIFLTDGTATCSKEMHAATLLNIAYGFGKLMTCKQLRQQA